MQLLCWPHLRRHRLRTALTTAGVAAGVAAVVGMSDVGASVLASFTHAVRTVAGDAALEVSSPAGPLDEALTPRVAAADGVQAAAGIVERFLPLIGDPATNLYLVGIDFLGSPVWERQFPRAAIHLEDELAFLAQTDSVLVTRTFAERHGLALESEVRVVAPAGPRVLRVRGFLDDVAPARLFGGDLAVMDLPAAQRLLGFDGRVDRLTVTVRPAVSVERTARVLQDTLGGDVTVASPEARGEQAEQLTLSLRAILLNASLIAIVVGGFVVYHMVAVSLCERRRSAAVANAVGVSPRAFVIVTLLETAALAGIGAVVGVAGGRWIGRMAAGTIGGVASDIWLEVDMLAERSSFNGIVAAIVLGIGGALCAAGLALRATFRASTIDAMRPSGLAGEGWDASRIAPVAGAVLLAATWGFAVTPVGLGVWPTASVMTARYAIGCAGVALLAPWLVSRVGRTGLRIARRSRSVAARLAMASLPRTPGRSGSAVATVAAAVAITVNLASLVTSFQHAWLAWLERHFAADLMVGGGDRVRLMAGPAMAAEVADRIGNIPGVAGVEPFRVVSIVFGDRTVFLQGLSTAQRLAHGGLPMVEGNLAAAAPALEAGTGVLLSDNLAYRLGLHRGDDITLPMPGGPRRARVEGTFVDFMGSLDLGSIVVATSALAAHWGDTHANLLRVWLAPGASVEAVRARIRETLGGQGYYVLAGRQFLDGVRDTLDRFFVGAWAMIVVSGLVGVVGIGAAQAAAVLDREAELKTLRMVGVSPRTLRRSIIGECGLLGGLGGAIGVALGLMLGVQMVRFGLRAFVGWSLPFVSPGAAPLAGVVAAAAGCSILAGWFPARAGSRLEAEAARID